MRIRIANASGFRIVEDMQTHIHAVQRETLYGVWETVRTGLEFGDAIKAMMDLILGDDEK